MIEVCPRSLAELSDCLQAAYLAGHAVVPQGFGSKRQLGRPPRRCDVLLSTRGLGRIVAQEAADMTVTVEAGVSLLELNQALAAAGQFLPIDPPLPQSTSIGGAIASDASGPWRLRYGKLRDALIGITVVLADGRVVNGGGRVVKNVAGYDLMKLFTGSLGTLGVIAAASFKVTPLPAHTVLVAAAAATAAEAARLAQRVLTAPLEPRLLSVVDARAAQALAFDGPHLLAGFAGSWSEIAAQTEHLQKLGSFTGVESDTAAYSVLRDLPATLAGESVLGAKLSLLPSRLPDLLAEIDARMLRLAAVPAMVCQAGNGIVTLRITHASSPVLMALATELLDLARSHRAWLVFDHVPAALRGQLDPWPMLPPAIELMRGIKRSLDPRGILNPGRFVGGI